MVTNTSSARSSIFLRRVTALFVGAVAEGAKTGGRLSHSQNQTARNTSTAWAAPAKA